MVIEWVTERGKRVLGTTAAWVPFFDDMNAIIFLAPISCFDQVLEEDPTVNRLVSFPFQRHIIVRYSRDVTMDTYCFENAGRFSAAMEVDCVERPTSADVPRALLEQN